MDVKFLIKIDAKRMYLFIAMNMAMRTVFFNRYENKEETSA